MAAEAAAACNTGTDLASYIALVFPQNPEVLYNVVHEYSVDPLTAGPSRCQYTNFLKGVKWSPDGACCLTASDDGWMRLFDLPPDALTCSAPPLLRPSQRASAQHSTQPSCQALTAPADGTGSATEHQHRQGEGPDAAGIDSDSSSGGWRPGAPDNLGAALRVQEGETVYDFTWFSRMTATEPLSCCFATTSRGHPVHLWDACTGDLRATYRGYNDVDEVTAAFSLAFTPDGSQLYAGYSKYILAFDVGRPGRDSRRIPCVVKGPGDYSAKLPGMVSCLAFTPDGGSLAAGTYSSSIGIFDPRIPELQMLLQGHKGGLTQLLFTHNGYYLLSGARQDPHLYCWDLRMASTTSSGGGGVLYRLERDTGSTNQRVGFSLEPCGRHVATGGCDGAVRVFDLQTGSLVDSLRVADDTVNGCDFHPYLQLLAVATGERRYPLSAAIDRDHPDHFSTAGGHTSDHQGGRPLKQMRLAEAQQVETDFKTGVRNALVHSVPARGMQGRVPGPDQGPGVLADGSNTGQGAVGSAADAGSAEQTRQSTGIRNALRILRMQHEVVYAPPVVDVG